MNPFYVAVMIVFVTVFASTAIVSEISMGLVSRSLGQLFSSEDSKEFGSSMQDMLVQGQVPKIGFGGISISQDSNRLNIHAVLDSTSDHAEVVIIDAVSFPAGLFSEHPERKVVASGENSVDFSIDGLKGSGNYKIKLRAFTENGEMINSTEAYIYVEPVNR